MISPDVVMEECAREFRVRPTDLVARGGDDLVRDARNVAMWYLHRVLLVEQAQVARAFQRERSLVSHASRRVAMLASVDHRFAGAVKNVKRRLGRVAMQGVDPDVCVGCSG